jgi:alkaline phosphatase D
MKKNYTFNFILIVLSSVMTYSISKAQAPALDTALAPFYHGVASGDPTNTRITLWTRVTPTGTGNVKTTWRMSTDTNFTNVVKSGTIYAKSTEDFNVHVNVTGLTANTWYYYQFKALNKYSLTGRTKTLPTGSTADSVRMAVMSCTNFQSGYFNAYEGLALRNDVDLIVYLGDYIYEYGKFGFGYDSSVHRVHDPITEAISLSDYQTRLSQYKLDPQTRFIQQQYPWICVWDDHEVADNAYKDGAANHDPATEGNWYDRLYAAKKAYFQWMPVRKPDLVNDTMRLYRNFTFGKLIKLEMLDTRLQGRTIQLASSDPNFNDTSRTMMGIAQRSWLFNDLNASTAKWNILGQQVMVAPLDVFGVPVNTDQWDGYPAERNRLLSNLQQNSSKNFVVLTGDIHSAWGNDLPLSGYGITNRSASAGVEFVTPSITSPNDYTSLNPGLIQLFNSEVRYVDLSYHGFEIIDVNKTRVQGDWYGVSTITSQTYTTNYKDSWKVNDGEKFLRHVTTASSRPANKMVPFAPSTPMPVLGPRMESENTDKNMIVLGVYPNPVSDNADVQLYLSIKSDLQITVTDISGKMVLSKNENEVAEGLHVERIDMTSLSKGVYILNINTNGYSYSRKLVKE